MSRSASSKAWLRRHVTDTYVHRARDEGYRSRAAFKLLQIDEKDRLLRQGMLVVDLGAAPGSWSQVALRRIGPSGRIVGIDLLPVAPLGGAVFIQADFSAESGQHAIEEALGGRPADLVLSDMAPNLTGVRVTDQARVMLLAELALEFACAHLRPGGHFLVKVFQGADFERFRNAMRAAFSQVAVRKPAASRGESAELFLLGRDFKGA